MRSPSTRPLVSVIVPSYNHGAYVRECLASIQAQTYDPIEIVVIDDGSQDASVAEIEAAREARPFTFLRNERNLGLNASLERALQHVTGEYVGILASDDLILPTKIAEQVAHLLGTGSDGVFAGGYLLHPDGRREQIPTARMAAMFRDGAILRHMQTSDTYGPLLQSGLFRTTMFREATPIRRQFKSDDWALTLHMLERYRIDFVDRPLFVYRQHPRNTFRDYWRTFPMRVEVLSQLTPEPLRFEGLANLFESQASYLESDGKRWQALRFRLAALALHSSPRRIARTGRDGLRTLLRSLTARPRGSADS